MSLSGKKIKKFIRSSEFKSMLYMMSSCVVFLLAFIINILLTNKGVDEETYGQYKYATNFILTVPLLTSIGINWSCASLIAKNKKSDTRGIITASVIWSAIVSLAVSLGLFALSFVLPLFGMDGFVSIRFIFPFVIVFMLQNLVNQIYSGLGESYSLIIFNMIPNVIVTVGMAVSVLIFKEIGYVWAISCFLVGNIASILPKLIKVKYDYRSLKSSTATLFKDVKNSGFKVYVSAIFTTCATQVIGLACASAYGFVEYGHYSLANSLAQVFQLIGSAMSTVSFRSFSSSNRIAGKKLLFMVLLGGAAYAVMNLIIGWVFFWFYPQSYAPAIAYMRLLCLAYLMYGFSHMFNRFFVSKGLGGKVMKNSAIIAAANIVITIPLVLIFEINGMVWSSIAVSCISVILYVIDYIFWCKKQKKGVTDEQSV